jgi:hypothetical protein
VTQRISNVKCRLFLTQHLIGTYPAAAETAQEQEEKHLALQARMTVLLADQEALAKEIASKKNCAKRKARRHQSAEAAGSGFIVVHASRSCEQSDEDVVYQHSFLEEGLNPKIDEALAVQDSAQAALDSEYKFFFFIAARFQSFVA